MSIEVYERTLGKNDDGKKGLVFVNPKKIKNIFRMKSKADIHPGDRVFYEIGKYTRTNPDGSWMHSSWKGSGMFYEIKDVETWLKEDSFLDDPNYIKHHNFTIQKKQD